MMIFCQLNSDPKVLIQVLGITFGNHPARLQERNKQKKEETLIFKENNSLNQEFQDEEYQIANKHLNAIREQVKRENSS